MNSSQVASSPYGSMVPPNLGDYAIARANFSWDAVQALQGDHQSHSHRLAAPVALKVVTRAVKFSEVPALLADGTHRSLLDVRKATEFEAGHLRDASNIAHTRLRPRLDEVPAGLPLLVHCASGLRAAGACASLSRAGRENICIADAFDKTPKGLLA